MKTKANFKSRLGFTTVEIVVVIAIMAAVSGMVMFSFSGLNEGASLNRSARDLALSIRKAQNFSLTVRQLLVGSPVPTSTLPPAIGIELTVGQSSYILYADLGTPIGDYKYNGLSEKIDPSLSLDKNTRIVSLTTPANSYDKVNIIFTAPEASVVLTDSTGSSIGNSLTITLQAPNTGQTKTVTIRTSGQITLK